MERTNPTMVIARSPYSPETQPWQCTRLSRLESVALFRPSVTKDIARGDHRIRTTLSASFVLTDSSALRCRSMVWMDRGCVVFLKNPIRRFARGVDRVTSLAYERPACGADSYVRRPPHQSTKGRATEQTVMVCMCQPPTKAASEEGGQSTPQG